MAVTFAATPRAHPGQVARSRGRRGRTVRRTLTGWAFVAPATIVVIGLSIFPAVWAFFISRAKWNGIAPATQVGWQNYERLATDPDMLAATRHTLLLTVLFVPSSIILGIVIAIALNQRIRLIGFYRTCIFVPYVASAAATGILASFVFNPQFGVVNDALRHIGLSPQQFLESPGQALYVIVVIALWGEVGFTTVIYLAALQDIPRDLVEAAPTAGGCSGTSRSRNCGRSPSSPRSGRPSPPCSCSTSSTPPPAAARSTAPRRSSTTSTSWPSRPNGWGTARPPRTCCSW
jgi:multiple sugar transport system permease protein